MESKYCRKIEKLLRHQNREKNVEPCFQNFRYYAQEQNSLWSAKANEIIAWDALAEGGRTLDDVYFQLRILFSSLNGNNSSLLVFSTVVLAGLGIICKQLNRKSTKLCFIDDNKKSFGRDCNFYDKFEMENGIFI